LSLPGDFVDRCESYSFETLFLAFLYEAICLTKVFIIPGKSRIFVAQHPTAFSLSSLCLQFPGDRCFFVASARGEVIGIASFRDVTRPFFVLTLSMSFSFSLFVGSFIFVWFLNGTGVDRTSVGK
jgi:hypothetical protein